MLFFKCLGAERGTAYYCRSRTFLKERQEATARCGGTTSGGLTSVDRAIGLVPWPRSGLAMLLDELDKGASPGLGQGALLLHGH